MRSSRGFRLLNLLLAAAILVAILSGCNFSKNKNDDTSSTVITEYPPTSGTSTSTSVTIGDGTSNGTEGSTRKTKTITSMSKIPGITGTDDVYGTKYAILPGDFCVIKSGSVKATIVISDNAGSNVVAAANDLALNLEKMTSKKFQIKTDKEKVSGNKILVGKSKYTDALNLKFPDTYPGEEMFQVIASANILVLAGNDAGVYKGSQFAVTYFLEALGFGWFGDDELWQVVPKADTIYATECNIVSKASFSSRYTRLNAAFPTLAARWYLGGELSEIDHKFPIFIPEDMYEEHPEYFAYSKGTRNPKNKRWWQICLSNTEVQNIVAEKVKQLFNDNPNYTCASIGQNDGNGDPNSSDYANWCECDDCKKFAPNFTEAMIKFANIIGSKIKKDYPGRTINFYAYFPTFEAPQTKIDIEDNVVLLLCKEGGLTRFIRNGNLFNADIGQTQFKDNFLNWKKVGFKNIAIYEWNCPGAASDAWKDMFWVQGEVFLDNLRWFKDNDVKFVFIDQGPNPAYERSADFLDIRWPLWYVSARGMWDHKLTFEEIMLPACRKLYGKAAQSMYEFYKALNDANKNCAAPNYYWALPEPNRFYTSEWVAKADAALEKALEIVEDGSKMQERVENQYQNWLLTKTYL